MGKNYRILITLILAVLSIFGAGCSSKCENKNIKKFPLEDNGYPKKDVALINGEKYTINDVYSAEDDLHSVQEIEIKLNENSADYLEVILPQLGIFHTWNTDPQYTNLVLYREDYVPIKNVYDGESNTLQTFRFKNSPLIDEIWFKSSPYEELGKTFEDRDYRHLLKVKITH